MRRKIFLGEKEVEGEACVEGIEIESSEKPLQGNLEATRDEIREKQLENERRLLRR